MKSQYLQNPPVVFRAKSGPWYTGFAVLVAVSVLVALAFSSGLSAVVTRGWSLIFLAYAIWYTLGRSHLVVGEEDITVVNPFWTHTVNYAALIDVSTRYNLTLVTAQKRYQAFGIPAGGMVASRRARPADLERLPSITYGEGGAMRTSDLPNSLAGSVALMIRGYWQEQVEANALAGVPAVCRSKADLAGSVLFAVLLVLAVIGLMM